MMTMAMMTTTRMMTTSLQDRCLDENPAIAGFFAFACR